MKKHHARRLLSFLASAHGFKPPFDVLLDSTAIQASLIHGVTLEEAVKKLLGEKVRLLVPRMVVAELHALGRKFAAAAKIARRLDIMDDPAGGATSAIEALINLVAGGNAKRRFIFSEDPEVKQELADIAGVPLLRFARSQLIVELPGGHAATSNASEPVAAAEPPPAAAAEATTTKKRKHVKEPNPLSRKKKRKMSPVGAAAPAVEGKKIRRGRRKRDDSGAGAAE